MKKLYLIIALMMMACSIWADYFVNFEGPTEVKASYASGSDTLSGINWNMTEALIGNLTADWKNGTKSARLRGYGTSSMTMLSDKEHGAGTVSFSYRRYGTDAQVEWKVEYSNDGGVTWTQIGNAFTAPASDVVSVFSEQVNIEGNIRIRILATTAGTVNKRLNIDDILITDYNESNPTASAPLLSPVQGTFYQPVTVTLSTSSPDATIYYTLDGTDPDDTDLIYSDPIVISQTTTLKAITYADHMNPSSIVTGIYTIQYPVDIANISTLRSQNADNSSVYRLTGEAVLTFKQTYRNQKYIQDATGAVLIDDPSNILQTTYNLYDGISGITGKLAIFGGMLQFTPIFQGATASSTSNIVEPITVTISQLINNFEDYESRLIKIENVIFELPSTFANGIVYSLTDGNNSYDLRTTFYDVDYIGTEMPSTPYTMVGIPNSRTDGNYFTPRSISDFIPICNPAQNLSFNLIQNDVTLNWDSPASGSSLDLSGYNIYRGAQIIATVASNVLTYQDLDVAEGTYTYSVKAGYGIIESEAATVEVTVTGGLVTQTIQMTAGWNTISANVMPENADIEAIFTGLANSGDLVKVIDEGGFTFEDLGGGFWYNGIGLLTATEGYSVYVNNDCSLVLQGTPVALPLTIPLMAGWNLISYPMTSETNAEALFTDLVNSGALVKVIDNLGFTFEDLGGGFWYNGIGDGVGNLIPGNGYYVYVNEDCTLTYTNGSGAPVRHMINNKKVKKAVNNQ